jgi:type IX secretion system PorP/SprF family membrane protein
MKKLLVIITVLSLHSIVTEAQVDPHFSQYYIFPAAVNPALTGSFDGDYRISGIYRSQWDNVSGGFKNLGFSGDAVTNKHLNIGAQFIQQTTGTGYIHQNGSVTFAYTGMRFGAEQMKVVSIGVQAGIISRRFDGSKFQTGEQWSSGSGYVPGSGTPEIMNNKAQSSFDAGAGIVYYDMTPDKKLNPYFGFSAAHINRPEGTFIADGRDKIPVRYAVHGGVAIQLTDVLMINPNVLYQRQGTSEEKMAGAYAQYTVNEQVKMLGGLYYRFKDAVVPFVGIDYKNLLIGLSYDVNNSDIGRSIANANTYEVSLSYIFKKTKVLQGRNLSCPRL